MAQEIKPVKFTLDAYEGPLDLLLHLIRVNEIDIFDIPIVAITEQYLDYLDLMKEVDINLSSEFMLMSATLIHVKTKMMLPRREDEDDPRTELVQRLLEHQQYQEAAKNLKTREEAELQVWNSGPRRTRKFVGVEEELVEVDIFQLVTAFHSLMKAIGRTRDLEMHHKEFTVDDKIHDLESALKVTPRMEFSELRRLCRTKREVIATFLAVLELLRRRFLKVMQASAFSEIFLVAADRSQQVIAMNGVETDYK